MNKSIGLAKSILGDRMTRFTIGSDSNSAVQIVFKREMSDEEMDTIISAFPPHIRVEFLLEEIKPVLIGLAAGEIHGIEIDEQGRAKVVGASKKDYGGKE